MSLYELGKYIHHYPSIIFGNMLHWTHICSCVVICSIMKISTRDFRLGNYDFYFHSWHNGFYLSKKSLCFISIYTVISYHTSVRLTIPKNLYEHDFYFQIQIFAKLVRKNRNVDGHKRLSNIILYPELSFLLRLTTSLSTLILQDSCKT